MRLDYQLLNWKRQRIPTAKSEHVGKKLSDMANSIAGKVIVHAESVLREAELKEKVGKYGNIVRELKSPTVIYRCFWYFASYGEQL